MSPDNPNNLDNPVQNHCERCGNYAPGRHRFMFHMSELHNFPNLPFGREFYCHRCIRIMNIYAIIGTVIAVIILGAIIAATIWAYSQGGTP